MAVKRYALVGTGHRGLGMFARPLAKDFPESAKLVGLCDANPLRLKAAAAELPDRVPTFTSFGRMLKRTDPDAVIVASRDCTHARYVIATLKAGKRAISEKPLCITAGQARQILAAAKESKGDCLVTHNARYGTADATIRSVIRSGRLGRVQFIQFDETLDRIHGADYFRRWHGRKENSGGLLLHKASHHFDMLNWWAGGKPEVVSATGQLRFYGHNGPFRHTRCAGCPHADKCEFHADMFVHEIYRKLYQQAESADGYFRDGCVFDNEIDIEDQMAVHIRYDNGIQVAYTLVAYSPYESQKVAIEGTLGRLEYSTGYNTGWLTGGKVLPGIEQIAREQLRLYLPGKGIEDVPIQRPEGGHGGADPALRQEFFGRSWDLPPTEQMASLAEAVQAVLIGAAANKSIATGRPVQVQKLLGE